MPEYYGIGYPSRRRYNLKAVMLPYATKEDLIRDISANLSPPNIISSSGANPEKDSSATIVQKVAKWATKHRRNVYIDIDASYKGQSRMYLVHQPPAKPKTTILSTMDSQRATLISKCKKLNTVRQKKGLLTQRCNATNEQLRRYLQTKGPKQ